MKQPRFAKYAWGVLIFNLPVIAFGGFVRATRSGDGCSNHWPLCDGQVIPLPHRIATVIEFTHRVTSGPLLSLLVIALVFGAFRSFPKRSPVRTGATLVLVCTLLEALLGAALVRFGWVGSNSSVQRAVVMALHLCLTFLLLAALTLTAHWASGGTAPKLKGQGAVGWALGLGLLVTILLAVSGAVTALGDTLYPPKDSLDVISQSLAPGAHFLTRLRPWHPLTAITVGLYLVLIAGLCAHLRPSAAVRRYGNWIAVAFATQLAAGFMNVLLRAPVAMQMVHLFLADLVWIALVLLCASALAGDVPQIETVAMSDRGPSPSGPAAPAFKSYIVLTKPKVISLLLFTTAAAMFAAAGGWPGAELLLSVMVGGYMSAGAANCINMVVERDLDMRMKRTSRRPTVTQNISSRNALLFGFGLGLGSFLLLWWRANLLAAALSLSGLVFYVVIYTLMLKRRTWQNIVIGGAAGAVPPLVGWAAVTGDLSALPWILFAIVFFWTPVHFWALALLMKDDYALAGVPMLPVVKGERATVMQIALYGVLTTGISALPLVWSVAGPIYLWSAVALNLVLLLRCYQLLMHPDRPRAVKLYTYSMLYLALLFLVVAVDRAGSHRVLPPAPHSVAAIASSS